jgi:hypothetical protein
MNEKAHSFLAVLQEPSGMNPYKAKEHIWTVDPNTPFDFGKANYGYVPNISEKHRTNRRRGRVLDHQQQQYHSHQQNNQIPSHRIAANDPKQPMQRNPSIPAFTQCLSMTPIHNHGLESPPKLYTYQNAPPSTFVSARAAISAAGLPLYKPRSGVKEFIFPLNQESLQPQQPAAPLSLLSSNPISKAIQDFQTPVSANNQPASLTTAPVTAASESSGGTSFEGLRGQNSNIMKNSRIASETKLSLESTQSEVELRARALVDIMAGATIAESQAGLFDATASQMIGVGEAGRVSTDFANAAGIVVGGFGRVEGLSSTSDTEWTGGEQVYLVHGAQNNLRPGNVQFLQHQESQAMRRNASGVMMMNPAQVQLQYQAWNPQIHSQTKTEFAIGSGNQSRDPRLRRQ